MVLWTLLLTACGARSPLGGTPLTLEGAQTPSGSAAASGVPGTQSAGGTSTSAGASSAIGGHTEFNGGPTAAGGAFASAGGGAAGGVAGAGQAGSGGDASREQRCGNGVIEPREECDDGGNANRDGCSSVCTFESLTIAIESKGHCIDDEQRVLFDLAELLRARRHAVYLVDASWLDTASELRKFDVIVLGGLRANCPTSSFPDNDLDAFDPLIPEFLDGGGGLVGSGWVLWGSYLDDAPNIAAALPTLRSDDNVPGSITPQPGTSFIARFPFQPFEAKKYAACAGASKPGADSILNAGVRDCGAIWQRGNGRAAFVGPLFNEPYSQYDNQALLDGSQPGSIELIVRLVEWAGGFY